MFNDITISRSNVIRNVIQHQRKQELVEVLRCTALVGSLEGNDTPTLTQRCSLARLIQGCNQVLRQLRNKAPQEAR